MLLWGEGEMLYDYPVSSLEFPLPEWHQWRFGKFGVDRQRQ